MSSTNKVPRGIRNHNPGNIRIGSTVWLGQVPKYKQTDKSFVQFETPYYGIRALAKILKNYQRKHGLRTVEEMIRRYAPPVENSTDHYVEFVESKVGYGIDMVNLPEACKMVKAIILYENGTVPYSDIDIENAVRHGIQ